MFVVFLLLGFSLIYLAIPSKKESRKLTHRLCGCIKLDDKNISIFGKNLLFNVRKKQVHIVFARKAPATVHESDVLACVAIWLTVWQKKKRVLKRIKISYHDKSMEVEVIPALVEQTVKTLREIIEVREKEQTERNHDIGKKCNACNFVTLCDGVLN